MGVTRHNTVLWYTILHKTTWSLFIHLAMWRYNSMSLGFKGSNKSKWHRRIWNHAIYSIVFNKVLWIWGGLFISHIYILYDKWFNLNMFPWFKLGSFSQGPSKRKKLIYCCAPKSNSLPKPCVRNYKKLTISLIVPPCIRFCTHKKI